MSRLRRWLREWLRPAEGMLHLPPYVDPRLREQREREPLTDAQWQKLFDERVAANEKERARVRQAELDREIPLFGELQEFVPAFLRPQAGDH